MRGCDCKRKHCIGSQAAVASQIPPPPQTTYIEPADNQNNNWQTKKTSELCNVWAPYEWLSLNTLVFMLTNRILINRLSSKNMIRSHLANCTQRKLSWTQVERVEIDVTIIDVQNSELFAWFRTG